MREHTEWLQRKTKMNVKPLFSLEDKSERDGTQKMLTVSFGLGFSRSDGFLLQSFYVEWKEEKT